jgi:bifunctional ADP-heptose synthase (sugar kinase/adenylyltransferase)
MDEYVNKGPGRPVYPLKQRMDHIRALECVHGVLPVRDALEALKSIKPDIFVKGREYEGKILPEHLDYCREHNIEIRFTDEPVYSSTALLRHELERG